MDMSEQKWCITCDEKWCTSHKCSNSYLVFFNPFDRDYEDEEQEENVEGKEVDLISEGNFVNQCVEGDLGTIVEEEVCTVESLELMDENPDFDGSVFIDDRSSDQMLEENSEKNLEQGVSMPKCLKLINDKPKRELEKDFSFSGKILETGSIIEEKVSTIEGFKVFAEAVEREHDFISTGQCFKLDSLGQLVKGKVFDEIFEQNEVRKALGMQIDVVDDDYGDQELFASSSIKGKKDLVIVDAAEFGDESGNAEDSENEEPKEGQHEDACYVDSEEKGRIYHEHLEELLHQIAHTALCCAAFVGAVGIAEVMGSKKPSLPGVCDNDRVSPLYMAASFGHQEMVWFLYKNARDEDLGDQGRIEILNTCICTHFLDVAVSFLKNQRDLTVSRDGNGEMTLLVLACKPSTFTMGSNSIICTTFAHSIPGIKNGLAEVEYEIVKNSFQFYNWYKGILVMASVYICEWLLKYKSKLIRVFPENILCCGVKKDDRKIQIFQFDPGGDGRPKWLKV